MMIWAGWFIFGLHTLFLFIKVGLGSTCESPVGHLNRVGHHDRNMLWERESSEWSIYFIHHWYYILTFHTDRIHYGSYFWSDRNGEQFNGLPEPRWHKSLYITGSDDGDLGSAIVDRNAEETPKTVRNLTERSLDHENRVLEYSSNLKDLANEIALSSPPFTPSLANQMHLRQSGSVFSTVSEQQTESVEERPQHLGSLETLATVEDGCTSEQRTFCPTAEELNFFRSGPLKFTVR